MNQQQLNKILEQHKLWAVVSDENEGERANLRIANLSGTDLSGANLTDAGLEGASLTAANLLGADLTGAHLTGANLNGAHLTGAYLAGAYLTGAKIDHNIRDCFQFRYTTFSPDALPWLILHPRWAEDKHTVTIVSEVKESA